MPFLAYVCLAIFIPVAPSLTSFGWAVLIGIAAVPMVAAGIDSAMTQDKRP